MCLGHVTLANDIKGPLKNLEQNQEYSHKSTHRCVPLNFMKTYFTHQTQDEQERIGN